ncbi:MAG: hypothetical protein K0Q49_2352 [Haloplasmataceae bacterium]|nr:hypothetical protein [Haloplasmataceae bacterium]
MKNNEMNKDHEYNELFNEFINSSEDKLFSKQEVKKIIEAHMYKNVLSHFDDSEIASKPRNILVTTKEISMKIFNIKNLVSFLLSYIFYLGFLAIIMNFIYKDLIGYKYTIFIIAFVFALIDKLVKPLLFIADLITFTIHKIGLITLFIYTAIFFILSNTINNSTTVSIEKSFIIVIIVLFLTFLIDLMKKDSSIKTKYLDTDEDETGSDVDE